MTAQVALLTSSSAVIAADSAVTIMGGSSSRASKVYTGVEKIYPLSDSEPLAALAYGAGSLVDVPWSTILNAFRSSREEGPAPSLEELGRELIAFAHQSLSGHLADRGDGLRKSHVLALVHELHDEAQRQVFEAIMESDEPSDELEAVPSKIAEKAEEIARSERKLWSDQELIDGLTKTEERRLHKESRPMVRTLLEEVFEQAPLSGPAKTAIGNLVLLSFTRRTPPDVSTEWTGGLVVAGFAEGKLWPGYVEFAVDGVGLEGIRYWELESGACLGRGAPVVRSFAQGEGIATMMNGIHPRLSDMILSAMVDAGLSRETAGATLDGVGGAWFEEQTIRILGTLDVMPTPDLCEVAESLVSITALWQRLLGTLETVGGTVSVAVLMPGGPLRWAKRPDLMTR